jgi:hypothetical protein
VGVWIALPTGIFLYVGARYLFSNLITGTSGGETIILTVVPIVLSVCVVAITIRVLR